MIPVLFPLLEMSMHRLAAKSSDTPFAENFDRGQAKISFQHSICA